MTHFDESCDPVKLMERNVSCLLYADDLVLISESAIGLQNSLNILSCYCDKWNLTVNLDKTKSMIFNKAGRKLNRESFLYKYLGIISKPSGIFTNAVEILCKKATKSLFCIRQLLISEKSNISTHLKLFQTCVKPILAYCSEIWSLNIVKSVLGIMAIITTSKVITLIW